MSDIDTNRLRNWAKAYQRLMVGGLSEQAHTACVDDFAADDGEFPYITAEDVLGLLDRLAAAEAAIERVRNLRALIQLTADDAEKHGNAFQISTAHLVAMLAHATKEQR